MHQIINQRGLISGIARTRVVEVRHCGAAVQALMLGLPADVEAVGYVGTLFQARTASIRYVEENIMSTSSNSGSWIAHSSSSWQHPLSGVAHSSGKALRTLLEWGIKPSECKTDNEMK